MSVWVTVATSLFSGVFATIITLVVTNALKKKERANQYKFEVFRELIAYRGDLVNGVASTGNFQRAINEVFIAYNDVEEVLKTFEEFRNSANSGIRTPADNDRIVSQLTTLLKAMAKEISIDYSFANDDLFTRPVLIAKSKN